MSIADFRKTIWQHYRNCQRAMPWRPPVLRIRADGSIDPYRILISEIMLQQTQVARVMHKYPAFVRRFPNIKSLAGARTADVLGAWSGLGYNRRALHLKRCAERIMEEYRGRVPRDPAGLASLPGIGRATAGAICAFAFNMPVAFIETNIRRVFIHFFFTRAPRVSDADILPLVAKTLPKKNARAWYYALMDYGAMLARAVPNPNRKSAHYAKQKAFAGSDRQMRGMVLRALGSHQRIPKRKLVATLGIPQRRFISILSSLEKEGMIAVSKNFVQYGP